MDDLEVGRADSHRVDTDQDFGGIGVGFARNKS
jgi:hypothetical protein